MGAESVSATSDDPEVRMTAKQKMIADLKASLLAPQAVNQVKSNMIGQKAKN